VRINTLPHTYLCLSAEGKYGTEVWLVKQLIIQKGVGGNPKEFVGSEGLSGIINQRPDR
jgi:hypothetical protein